MNEGLVCVIGVIIGILIGRIYFPRVAYHGPNSSDIKKRVYQHKATKRCYRLVPRVYINTKHTDV